LIDGMRRMQPVTNGTKRRKKRSFRNSPVPRRESEAKADQPAKRKNSGMCQRLMKPQRMRKKKDTSVLRTW
jgi:hypothetical protein